MSFSDHTIHAVLARMEESHHRHTKDILLADIEKMTEGGINALSCCFLEAAAKRASNRRDHWTARRLNLILKTIRTKDSVARGIERAERDVGRRRLRRGRRS